ncbi:MAG: hypothetical protein AB9879_09675 [Methanothrix sp.]
MEKKYVEQSELSWSAIRSMLAGCFDTLYAPIGNGVSYGNSHAHTVGAGGSIFQVHLIDPYSLYTCSGWLITLTANETQALGDVCYIDSSGKARIAKADAMANANAIVVCVDTAGISAGASGNYISYGKVKNAAWNWTAGGLIYLSTTGTTGNTLTQTKPSGSGNVVQILGVALSATIILFQPSLVQVEL